MVKTKRFFGTLYVQVLIAVFAGILLGVFYPKVGADLKPLGDTFIKLIKMVFAPVIFATVVLGIGLLMVNLIGPGRGMNIDPTTLDSKSIATYTSSAAKQGSFIDFLMH